MVKRDSLRQYRFWTIRLVAMVLLLLPAFLCPYASVEAEPLPKEQPVEITSERLNADYATGKIRFLGNVVAIKGDLTIYSEELILYLEEGGQSGQGGRKVREIEAFKNVRIVQGERVATGQAARFDDKAGTVVLTGSPKVREGNNFVEGDKITVFLNEDRSIATSKPGSRTKAVFHPGEKGNAP